MDFNPVFDVTLVYSEFSEVLMREDQSNQSDPGAPERARVSRGALATPRRLSVLDTPERLPPRFQSNLLTYVWVKLYSLEVQFSKGSTQQEVDNQFFGGVNPKI
jgi:hypothetical protein